MGLSTAAEAWTRRAGMWNDEDNLFKKEVLSDYSSVNPRLFIEEDATMH